MSATCGQCGAPTADDKSKRYAVRVDGQWIARFTSPGAEVDKAWEASEGLRLASRCKAIVGAVPYLWTHADNARYTAQLLSGEHVSICGHCVPKPPKKTRKAKHHGEDETDS